jgi:Asp-tRNA(Asn)/Glu-tRNA(Gln) amidotransferase A subunit family amidase
MSLLEAAKRIQTGEISSFELVNQALAINESRAELNVFAFLASDEARATSEILDQETKAGISRGTLHGVPITIKDLFNVVNMPTKAGTNAVLPLEFQTVQSSV